MICRSKWFVVYVLLLFAIVGMNGCGGGGGASSVDPKALKSVGWYYDNMPPDFFNNGTSCYLNVILYLSESFTAADVDSFTIDAPNGGRWSIQTSGRQPRISSSGVTYFPLLLRFDVPEAFPLAGTWTMTVRLKDGRTSSIENTFHDPGSSASATYKYLYTPEDWSPTGDQSQYVAALKRFPSAGYSFRYSSANGGEITSAGYSSVQTAFMAAEPKAFNWNCWLYDENRTYLGYTIRTYSGTDHSRSTLVAQDGELVITAAATSTPSGEGSVDLSKVKYVRVVVVDGAQFVPQYYSAFDQRSVSALIPVAAEVVQSSGGNGSGLAVVAPPPPPPPVPATEPPPLSVPSGGVSTDSYQSYIARYSISVPSNVRQGDSVQVTFTVENISGSDINIGALPILVRRNGTQFYRSNNVIPSGPVNIKPGETKTMTATWNNRDQDGNLVPPATYELVGSCMGQTEMTDLLVNITVQ